MEDPDLSSQDPLDRLMAGLPAPVRRMTGWLLRPGAGWLRLPIGTVLIICGVFGFLPILGFWMVPIGAVLLAEDIPAVRRPTIRALGAVQRWWDRRRAGRLGRP